jgi:hypothetical protein
MSTASTPLVWAAEAAGESDIPFCLSGVAGSSGSGCPRGGRVDGAVRGLLVDHKAWERLDQRAVSTMLANIVDTVSKRVFTCRSSSRNDPPNDCHSLANRSFSGSRSARWRCWGPRAAGRPRFPWLGQWSRVRQPTGTRYVESPRGQPGTSAAKLRDYTRALREVRPDYGPDCPMDQIALDAINHDLRS